MNDATSSQRKAPPARTLPRRIERSRLLARLDAARGQRCVVLHGPAGCGKTTLLESWRPLLVETNVDVVWLSVPWCGDGSAFSSLLCQAIAPIAPRAAAEAERIATRRDAPMTDEHVLITLLAGVEQYGAKFALIIDAGAGQPAAEWVHCLQFILDEAPANLLTVIASRRPLPLALSRLRAHAQLLELDFEDLRFTTGEMQEFLTASGANLAHADIRALRSATEGWPIALRMIVTGSRVRAAPEVPERWCSRELQRYLESEVLGTLSPAETALLAAASVPARVCAALTVELQGATMPLETAMCLMDRLSTSNLLRPVHGAPGNWRRVQPLVRAVFLRRLQASPRDERQRLHRIAWKWFEGDGNPVGAIHHARLAGALDEAEALAERWLPALFEQGRIWDLVRVFRELPGELHARPSLRPWLAWYELLQRDFDACRSTLALLQSHALSPSDCFRVTLLRAVLAMLCDDLQTALALIPQLTAPPAEAEDFALAGRRSVLVWTYLRSGEHSKARQAQSEGPPVIKGRELSGTPFGALSVECLVGLSYAVEGRILLAERTYREILYQAELRGGECADEACTAAALLAEILYELNDIEGATELLQRSSNLQDRVSMPDTVLRVMLTLARTHCLSGRTREAFDALAWLTRYARERSLQRLLAYGLLEQLVLHLRVGEHAAALACDDQLRLLAPAADSQIGPWNVDLVLTARHARIAIARHEGRLLDALEECDALIEHCRSHGRLRRAAIVALQAAVIERSRGHGSAAMHRLRTAVRLGRSLGLVRSLLDADPAATALLQEAVDNGEFDTVDAIDARRLCAAAHGVERHALASRESAAQESASAVRLLNDRERELAPLLAQGMSNKQIARVLGLSPETVKWHLKNIYLKLGVCSRIEVVARLQPSSVPPARRIAALPRKPLVPVRSAGFVQFDSNGAQGPVANAPTPVQARIIGRPDEEETPMGHSASSSSLDGFEAKRFR